MSPEQTQNLENHLSPEDMLAPQNVVRQTAETISERLAETHTRKINNLIGKTRNDQPWLTKRNGLSTNPNGI